jgi:hypothetical protein
MFSHSVLSHAFLRWCIQCLQHHRYSEWYSERDDGSTMSYPPTQDGCTQQQHVSHGSVNRETWVTIKFHILRTPPCHPSKGHSRSRAKVLRKASKTTTYVVPSTGQGSTLPMRYALMLYPLPVYPQLMGEKPDTRRTQPRVTHKRQPAMHACMLKAI